MKNIAIFASGEGTNAQNMINYFAQSEKIKIALVVSNKPAANVLNRAKNAGIPTLLIDQKSFYDSDETIERLKLSTIDLIVLAGFLWLIPERMVKAFPNKIINIHPALLPKYGGKGMHGMNIHKAVIDAKEKESGISIHYVNEKYDEGEIISQHKCTLTGNDNPESLAQKIHQLEFDYFPKAVEQILNK